MRYVDIFNFNRRSFLFWGGGMLFGDGIFVEFPGKKESEKISDQADLFSGEILIDSSGLLLGDATGLLSSHG